jgi:hypothetical protein
VSGGIRVSTRTDQVHARRVSSWEREMTGSTMRRDETMAPPLRKYHQDCSHTAAVTAISQKFARTTRSGAVAGRAGGEALGATPGSGAVAAGAGCESLGAVDRVVGQRDEPVGELVGHRVVLGQAILLQHR